MTTSCEEDAALTGPVSLFCGIETWNWNLQQFLDMATWAKQHGVSTLFIKVSEVGSTAGDIWYGGFGAWDVIYQELQKIINVIPYSFPYGDQDIQKEISIAVGMLRKYGKFCLDMEGGRWSTPDAASRAKQFADALTPIPGKLWLSCPADPVINNQLPFLQAMSPATNVWMPMIYDDHLAGTWQPDFSQINAQACLQPTLDLSQEFGANNVQNIVQQMVDNGIHAISFWYEGFAKQNPGLLDALVGEFTRKPTIGGSSVVQINKNGNVCDVWQTYQLETEKLPNVPGSPQGQYESEDLCGPWAMCSLKYAGQPGKGAQGTQEDVDRCADDEADKWWGTHYGDLGSSIPDMHNFLHDNHMHYWDITPDVNRIRAAIHAGYPVLITANEQNIIEKKTGQRAYPWNLNANHIIPLTGVDGQGDFHSPDQLNNAFQGYWPVTYLAGRLNPSWACVVQLVGPNAATPWLKPIPSGDPLNWPKGFNAQNFGGGGTPTPPPQVTKRSTWMTSGQEHQAHLTWDIGHRIVPILFQGKDVPADNSGIKNDWVSRYMNGLNMGYATTPETPYVGWDDKPIVAVWWSNGYRTEWDGSAHVYNAANQRIA